MKLPPEEHHQHDDEEDEGQRIEDVDDAHHDLVDPAAGKTGYAAIDHADQHRDDAAEDADGKRDAPGDQRSREEVAAAWVGAEQEIVLLDRRHHDEPAAIRRSFHHPGILEGRGAIEIAGDAPIDRLGRGDGDDDFAMVELPLLYRHPRPAHCILERASHHLGLGIGREARRHPHIVLVDGVEGVAGEERPEDATEQSCREGRCRSNRRRGWP